MKKEAYNVKKECEDVINGLNICIDSYNRSVLKNHPDYELDKVIFPKR